MAPSRPSARLALTILAVAAVPGCSFIFSEGPPAQHAQLPYFDCSSNYAPPVIDTVWAGLNGIGALRALATSEADWNADISREGTIAIGLVWLALSGSSAIYGYNKVGSCREAKNQLMLRLSRPPGTPPQSWPPHSWPPPPGTGAPPPSYPPPGYPPPGQPPAPAPAPPAPAPPPSDWQPPVSPPT